jgi:hypothetical protein
LGARAEVGQVAAGGLGQQAQMQTLVGGQEQGLGDGGEDLRGGLAVASLLEPGQVFDADAGERGEFGSAQAGGATSGASGQADVGRGYAFAATAEEFA